MSKSYEKKAGKKAYKKHKSSKKKQGWGVYTVGNKPELHYLDSEPGYGAGGPNFICPTNGATYGQVINVTMQGAASYQRIGDTIKGHSVHVRATVCMIPPGTANRDNYTAYSVTNLRMMVVYDRDPSPAGTYPTLAEVLADRNGGAAFTNGLSGNNMQETKRFRVLMDKIWTLNSDGASGAMPDMQKDRQIDFYYKLNGIETRFKGFTGVNALADVTNGAILIVVYQETFIPSFSAPGRVAADGSSAPACSQFGVQCHARYKWTED